ncbi:MAG: hypothetical protein P4M14_00260 [Gammaproteobacteria bacterium]|nr:hypothetical protein [Gammaproteobacteria bacterium]
MALPRTDDTPVLFMNTQRTYATFFKRDGSNIIPCAATTATDKLTLLGIPLDAQNEIFAFVRTLSAARIITTCKEVAGAISQNHEGYQDAAHGHAIRAAVINDLNAASKTSYTQLPAWYFLMDCEALELIGRHVISLRELIEESVTNPWSFFQFIFDKAVLKALRKEWVSLDQLINLLKLKDDAQVNDTVYALFQSQACGEDLVARLSAIIGAETELAACGIAIDRKFVEKFLNKEINGPQQRYEMYLDDIIALHSRVRNEPADEEKKSASPTFGR